jgi:Na+/H+ antiporter NhaD/arsenite permease-like protein
MINRSGLHQLGVQTAKSYLNMFIIYVVNHAFFFNYQFWHQFQAEKKDYSLKQILESVANAKQHAYHSLSIIMLTMKHILFTIRFIYCTIYINTNEYLNDFYSLLYK